MMEPLTSYIIAHPFEAITVIKQCLHRHWDFCPCQQVFWHTPCDQNALVVKPGDEILKKANAIFNKISLKKLFYFNW